MLKKIISYALILSFVFSMMINVSANNIGDTTSINIEDINFITPDEQILSTATINDDFADDSVIVIFTTEASRNNRDFTAEDFKDIGALKVEDITRLSDKEYSNIEPVWTAQEQMEKSARRDMLNRSIINGGVSSETYEAVVQYEVVKEAAEENTMVNVDEFRRIVLITLAEPGKANVMQAIETLKLRDDIRYAGPNYIMGEALDSTVSNDPRIDEQWAFNKISLPNAWDITTGSATVNVGILDTGINGEHEDLKNRINTQLSRDYAETTNGLVDSNGHGTHVAGIIGAQGGNSIGISGINWDVRLVSLKVLTSSGTWGSNGRSAVAMAVNHARENNIPILNASLKIGYDDEANQPIRDAVAGYTGLFIQSAGNSSENTNDSARFEGFNNVIVVGSTDANDNCSTFSNWGSTSVHLFAPGTSILSTYEEGYASLSGTSMAAPHVAGVLALMIARYPNLSMAQQKTIILNSVDQLSQLSELSMTGGRLNANKALYEAGADSPVYITVTAGEGGTITGGGIYDYGDTVTLTATPNTGYDFIGWYENDIRINGAESTYSFVAEDYRELEARFMQQTGSETPVYIMATAGEGGIVVGGGTYFYGDIVELTAIPDTGYTFEGWYEDDVKINGAESTYSFVAEDFRMLEARFN